MMVLTCSPPKVSTTYPLAWIDLLVDARGYFVALEVSSLMSPGRLAAWGDNATIFCIMLLRVAALTIIVASSKSERKAK
jgi:hypothetical protein